jgi:hypothetical protein
MRSDDEQVNEIERLKELLEEKAEALVTAEARVRELEAENERLRAEVALAWDDEDESKRANAAESSLAAATALPGRIWEALGELTSYLVDGDHMVRVDQVRGVFERFLANNPSAQWELATDEYDRITWNQPAQPYVQPKGKAGQVIQMSEPFEYVGSTSSPLPPAFEAANAAHQPAAPPAVI